MKLAYVFLSRFPVQRRVAETPSLRGQPVVLFTQDARGVQRVRFASAAALKFGVRPNMTVAAASALVPSLERCALDEAGDKAALLSLGEALLALAPGFQCDAPEGLWLDASAWRLFGDEKAWAKRVVEVCSGLGFHARCAVGEERFTTQAIARWTEPVVQVVPPHGGATLASLPLVALESGWVMEGSTAPFRELGLSTLGELSALSPPALVARFGAVGHHVARLCRGDDDSRLVPDALPEVLEEAITLDWPAEQLEPLLFALKTAVDRLCARLQGRQQVAMRLTVSLKLEHAEPMSVPLVLARPSSQSRLLVELMRHRLTDLTVRNPVAGLHVRVDESGKDPGRQLMLGDAPEGDAELEVVLARLQSALGPQALFSAVPQARHKPEEGWAAANFRPPDSGRVSDLLGGPEDAQWVLGKVSEATPAPAVTVDMPAPPTPPPITTQPPDTYRLPDPYAEAYGWANDSVARREKRPAKVEGKPITSTLTAAQRPTRLFRAPTALQAELSTQGQLVAMNVAGRRRSVQGVWGPERLVGDWWAPEAFARDYYRVQLEGVGVLWVYRDGNDGRFYAQGVFD